MKTIMNKNLEVRSEQLETNRSAALPYSSNSYLLNPDSLPSRQRRDSGMILLLVIALLVLLALMGTVFILMASADRKSAYASNSSASLNMAQQGVLNTVRGLMLNASLDQNGQTLAVEAPAGSGFTPDTQIARFWDYPEVGAISSGGAVGEFYQSVTAGTQPTPTQYAPSEPWLVSNQPYEPGSFYVPGEEVFYYTTAGTRWVYVGPVNSAPTPPSSTNTTYWQPVTAPTVGYCGASGTATPTVPLISTFSPYLYDPGPTGTYGGTTFNGGAYNVGWYLAGTTPPSGVPSVPVPNAAVVEPRWTYDAASNPQLRQLGTPDAMWNLLPYSDPNGTRYRFALRVVDTSSLLNLNSGWIANAYGSATENTSESNDPYGVYGAFIGSAPILNQAGLNIDPADLTYSATKGTPVQLGLGSTLGRVGNLALDGSQPEFSKFQAPSQLLPAWQGALDEYEIQFPQPPGAPTFQAALFGTNSAMDLLTAGGAGNAVFGTPVYTRLTTLLPNTLGFPFAASGYYFGSGYRNLYTTYSFGRDVAPIKLGTSSTGTAPPKVNLNASVTSAKQLQSLADSLYTAMVASGYNAQHAREFLVNYFTYRFDTTGYSTSPAYLTAANLLTVPMGGSTISTALPTTSVPAGVACMGTTAQPFLNEVEVQLTEKNGATAVTDWAIELANPFPGTNALPCTNYSLAVYFGGSKSPSFTIALGGNLTGYGAGNGYIGVVALKGGTLYGQASGDSDGFVLASSDAFRVGTVTIDLLRNNVSGAAGAVTVDSMTIDIPQIPAASKSPLYYDVARDNTVSAGGMWGCDSAAVLATPTPVAGPIGSIGTSNGPVTTGGEPGVVLYDRWYSGDQVAPGATAGTDLANINDLNCIARECTTSTEPLSQQIDTNIAAAGPHTSYAPPQNLGMYYVFHAHALAYLTIPVAAGQTNSPELSESALYFDFAYDPRAAYNAVDASFGDPQVTVLGEIPPTFLSCTTLTDRSQSNTTAAIALPEGTADLVRQAGKININTAGPDVLYSAFSEDGALWNGSTAPTALAVSRLVDDAIGFRGRLPSTGLVPQFTVTGTGSSATVNVAMAAGVNNYNTYGGVGYQSTADLLVAFLPTIFTPGDLYSGSVAPSTIQQRDAAWADVENFLTVRSDTFAVYGLVQALRLNPAYSAAAAAGNATYLPTDWYNASQGIVVGTGTKYYEGSISTDPTNPNAEFILEGSRRFIAIVDRSYCNNGATVQPHIVALKILPQ